MIQITIHDFQVIIFQVNHMMFKFYTVKQVFFVYSNFHNITNNKIIRLKNNHALTNSLILKTIINHLI